MKELYIHIGYPKTGTTAIQNYFDFNQKKILSKSKTLYPDVGKIWTGHHLLAAAALEERLVPEWIPPINDKSKDWNKLHKLVQASNCNKILISSEVFNFIRDFEFLRDVTSGYKVKIIVLLRRQDEWLESAYNQLYKTAVIVNETIQDAKESRLRNHRLDYFEFLKPWSSAFGKENILVIPFEKEQLSEGLLQKIFQMTDIALSDTFKEPPFSSNETLGPLALEYANKLLQKSDAGFNSGRLFSLLEQYSQEFENTRAYKRYRMNPAERNELLQRLHESNQNVAKMYLDRVDGNLFFSTWPDPNEIWHKYEDNFDANTFIDITIWILSKLDQELESVGNEWRKQNRWIGHIEAICKKFGIDL